MNGCHRSLGISEIETLLMVRILGLIQANGRWALKTFWRKSSGIERAPEQRLSIAR
jgi:hypothetical protein